MEKIYQVSELGTLIKRTLEELAPRIRIAGEISDPMVSSKGYFYATLKDEKATINMACFAPQRFTFKPQHGQQIIVTGKLTAYPQRSQYQFLIEQIELAGLGAILQAIEERKKRLTAEGLFDQTRKRKLPLLPRRIAVITSPTGAVIRDIIHRLQARFPLEVYLWPVNVQGDLAVPQILQAFKNISDTSNIPKPNLVIIARGGGSIEDLMPFNDEALVRAVAACPIPVISAVGHETDTTLCDFAADLRAPTPTAAAELAVPVRSDLLYTIAQKQQRLQISLQRRAEQSRLRYQNYSDRLPQLLPRRLQEHAQHLDNLHMHLARGLESWRQKRAHQVQLLTARLQSAKPGLKPAQQQLQQLKYRLIQSLPMQLQRRQQRIAALERQLHALGPYQVLQRGYTITETTDGQVLSAAAQAKSGMHLLTRFHDGVVESVVGK